MSTTERPDPGLFGPGSVSWRVLREASVMIGGVRALLMHAAHSLVVAGARQTAMYERDPWRRLERTLRLSFTVVFGTGQEAVAAARRIDQVHRGIRGVDPVTGLRYDARDPELLLWVHACLVDSFLELERLTVGWLDGAGCGGSSASWPSPPCRRGCGSCTGSTTGRSTSCACGRSAPSCAWTAR
jgi:uncharacterized protein (DUF2236 family)